MKHYNSENYYKIKSRLQKFCEDTTLDGYKEMYNAKSSAWTIVWFVIVFGANGVTIYQVIRATLQYLEQSSITEITPLNPGGLLYPPVYVCYPHWVYWLDWEKAYSMNFTKESILYSLSFTTDIFSENVFDVTEAKINLTKTMEANNIRTFTELFNAIAMPFPSIMMSPDGLPIPVLDKNPQIFKSAKLVWKTRSYFMCYKMDGDEILNLVQPKNATIFHTRRKPNIFTFSVLDPDYSFINNHVTYKEYNYYMAFWLCRNSNYWINSLHDFSMDYTDFTLPLQVYPDAYSDSYVEVNKDNDEYSVEMAPTAHVWKNTRSSPCLERQRSISTDSNCQTNCLARVDMELMVCRFIDEAALLGLDNDADKMCSFSINFLQDNLETLDAAVPCYNFPNEVNSTGNIPPLKVSYEQFQFEYKECCSHCQNTCEVWKYTFEVSSLSLSTVIKKYTFKNQTDISISYPQESDVMIVIQLDSRTWEQFVGNVGGLLGVWTGASILSLLQLVYLCCFIETTCGCCTKSSFLKTVVQDISSQKKDPSRIKSSSPNVVNLSYRAAEKKIAEVEGKTYKKLFKVIQNDTGKNY